MTRSGTRPDTVRKEARTAEERDRLGREGRVLAVARHPGVVEVLDVQPDHIVLRAVDGGTLSARGCLARAEVVALGAVIATTLADLHDLGVVHGRVAPDHVLLDTDATPVLCGFGQGRCPADDVADLGKMLSSLLPPGPSGALAGVLAQATHPRPGRRPTARRLARTLAALAAGPPRPATSQRVVQWVAAGAAGATVLGIGLARLAPPPLRYRVGVPGDQVVTGRWRCPGVARPAVLRPSTGEVWAYLPDARLVATVPGATALRVTAATAGCDRLVILRSSGRPVTVNPG